MNPFIIFLSLIINLQMYAEWHNWAYNQSCNPKVVLSPRNKEELINIIKKTSCDNHKISIVGASHSFSSIACSDDYVISMENFNNIISVDTNRMQVCAEGGILINDFNKYSAHYGLALSNLPAIGGMTLAGALCTATHGTGHSGTLSDFVTQVELITADGTVHMLSPEHNEEAFKAACVSLGMLGVMYSVTMQCEPSFMLAYQEKKMYVDELLLQYHQLNQQSDYFQFRWQLQDDSVYADIWNRIPLDSSHSLVAKTSYEALQWYTDNERGLVSEIALPVDVLPQAVSSIKELYTQWLQRGLVISEVTCRFVKADKNSYLSPAAGCDVVYITIGTDVETKYYEVFKDFEEAMYLLKGRPHWGKVNFLNYERACTLYGENLIKFIKIKNHFDPNNIFSNAYINNIFNTKKSEIS